ncbi:MULTISPECIES: hypothetical protein [unclassified Ruegeria]|uniref:hypothetical protein n=1 Tax=unclassified Ruegeria TaxID=2625375 RepID=UPI001489CB31|nr:MULTISPECIES: hypothetical protein [unclassified Ruegeria]NOD34296.1 hypothetical protein [Ruegeria sp. HKCCD7296]NOE41320.1 hypothetical protein [Ruegeria sp. HKCCD7319]
MKLNGLLGKLLSGGASDNRRVKPKSETVRHDRATRSEMTVLLRKELHKPVSKRAGHAQIDARDKLG